MRNAAHAVLTVLVLTGMGGCATAPDRLVHTPQFEPVHPVAIPAAAAPTGAIFNGRHSIDLFSRGLNHQVGDIITVLLNESAQAARQQSTQVNRESSNDVVPAGLTRKLGNLSPFTDGINLNGANISSEGQGVADQRASLTGSISATVIEILANGNLVVRGEKQLALTEGTEVIQVSGIIRPADISPNNTVQSRRLANAQITYRGTGSLVQASKPGWGTGLLMRFWPF
jgi:flagellar L-ring protein precursor FlgH